MAVPGVAYGGGGGAAALRALIETSQPGKTRAVPGAGLAAGTTAPHRPARLLPFILTIY